MKPAPFHYHDPRNKDDLLRLLAGIENGVLLAGGQSLMPMLNFRAVTPDHVVDLSRVRELAGISRDGDTLTIGAMTRQRDIERSDTVRDTLPLLQDALAHVGHRQTRNRGTIGGSLCHLDPSAELVTAAVALDATLVAERSGSVRSIPAKDWCRGYLTNALEQGEMLSAVELPVWAEGHGHAFVEYARRHGDFAIVGVAVLLALDTNGAISRAAIAVGGCAAQPQRLADVEAGLVGQQPATALFKDLARLASNVEAISDPYVQADYRRHLARVLTERALNAAAGRAAKAAA